MKAKGFRKIDNHYFEALMAADFTRSGYKVVFAVIHKSWGWQKESEIISLTEFTKMTRLSRPAVIEAIRRLQAQQVIKTLRNGNSKAYSINEWQQWTGKAHLTSSSKAQVTTNNEIGFTTEGEKTLPANDENFTRASKVPVSTTQPSKEKRNLLKKLIKEKENDIIDNDGFGSLDKPTPSNLQGNDSLKGNDMKGVIPSRLTAKEEIVAYLQKNGPSSKADISDYTGIQLKDVYVCLEWSRITVDGKCGRQFVEVSPDIWTLKDGD